MSYTKGEIAKHALEELGLAGYDFDITPDELQSAIRRLDMMMAEWSSRGIKIPYPISKEENSSPSDDTYLPDWTWEAVVTNLAIKIAPSYGKTVSMDTRATAKRAYGSMCSVFMSPPKKQLSSMPMGAGYKSTDSRFTPAPGDPYLDLVDEDVDLTGGP